MSYYYCKVCCSKHGIGLGCPQAVTNVTNEVPKRALDNFELDKAMGAFPEDGTYEEWRATLKGEPGLNGQGINIKGNLPSYAALLAVVDPQPGDTYSVSGPTPQDPALLYTYDKENGWPAEGNGVPVQGEPGAPGADGDTLIPESTSNYFDI